MCDEEPRQNKAMLNNKARRGKIKRSHKYKKERCKTIQILIKFLNCSARDYREIHPSQATFCSPHFLSFSANENVTFVYAYM